MRILVKYLVKRTYKGKTRFYWLPKKHYKVGGIVKPCPLHQENLGTNETAAIQRAQWLNNKLHQWRTETIELRSMPGSIGWLMQQYRASGDFKNLGERTRKEYGYILNHVEDLLRDRDLLDAPAAEFTRPHAKSLVANFKATNRKMQLVAAIMRIVFNYGENEGLYEGNPFTNMRIKKNKPRQHIWLDLEADDIFHWIKALINAAAEAGLYSVAAAIVTALHTAQRENDILSFPRKNYNGQAFTLKQSKTGAVISVPVLPALKNALDHLPEIAPVMIISERTGKQFTKNSFGHIFAEIRTLAGVPDNLQFRDFRRTAVVLLGMSGCTVPEISSITGHSHAEASNILETYLPPNSDIAKNATAKLDRAFGKKLKKIQIPVKKS